MSNKVYLVFPEKIGKIEPNMYGVFAEHIGGVIYNGIYVGENAAADNIHGFRRELIDHIKEARIPLIRWPGGCYAEVYNWRDGIGPKDKRPVRINWWTAFDGKYEPNLVGTDEFLDFCSLCNAEPYLAANITTTTPLDIRDWVDYCNSPADTTTYAKLRAQNGHREPYGVRLWGIGNETWGGGGNMTPESYAMAYRQYSTVIDTASKGLEFICSGANAGDVSWTRGVLQTMKDSEKHMSGLSFHYYCGGAGDPVAFTEQEWYQLLRQADKMQELIDRHWAAAVSYHMEDKAKLCIDEWGCWHPDNSGPSHGANLFEQQSTLRDAAVTALTLHTFNNNCEKIKLCTVAQLVNNLHCLFFADGDRCVCTPTYHVFKMLAPHQNGQAIRTLTDVPDAAEQVAGLSVSASVKDGYLTVTAVNLSADKDTEVKLEAFGANLDGEAEITTLCHTDIHAHNTFENPCAVAPVTSVCSDFKGVVAIPHGGVVCVRCRYDGGKKA